MMRISLFIATPGMPSVKYVHLFTDTLDKNVERAARLGFDGVELLIDDPDTFNVDELDMALKKNRMALAAVNSGRMAFQYGVTLIHPEKAVRESAFQKLQAMARIAGRFGCDVSIGLFRGKALEDKPIAFTRDMFVEIMREACDYAATLGVGLNFEPTNRFETNFIHTTDEGLDIIRRVDRPNLGLLLDLYHMYIEDPDMEESIRKSGAHVKHFHFSDSDRSPAGLGRGVIDFQALVGVLKEIHYDGFLSEGLVTGMDVDESAQRTVRFLRDLVKN